MATPITHIYFAEKVLNKFFPDKKKSDFYVGTSFPDIRYLGVIDREKVHHYGLDINNLKKESSFTAGYKFHSIVDEIGGRFFANSGLDFSNYDSVHLGRALKFYADQLLYEKVNNWSEISKYFDRVMEREVAFGIKKDDVLIWHKRLQDYFSSWPSEDQIKRLMNPMIGEKDAGEILKLINNFNQKEEIKEAIIKMENDFEKLITTG